MNPTRVILNSVAGGLLLIAFVLIVIPVGGPYLCGSALFPNFAIDSYSGEPIFRAVPICTSTQNGIWVLFIVLAIAATVLFVIAARHRPAPTVEVVV